MKIVDKHLLRTLVFPLAYCLMAFTILIIIHDLFDNLGDFIEAQTPLKAIVRFYLMLFPSVLILIVPISLLLSSLYSLLQLSKNNELTAMRASGISLYRLVLPFFMVALGFSILTAVIYETISPWTAYWCEQFIKEQKHKKQGLDSIYAVGNLPFRNEPGRRLWMIGKFHTQDYTMKQVTITQEREDGSAQRKIYADSAEWLDGSWWLHDVTIQELDEYGNPKRIYDENRNPLGTTTHEELMELADYNEEPDDFLNEIKDPQFLSSRELVEFIKTRTQLSEDRRTQIKVDLHNRLAMPWMSLIVALLGIPFGTQTARKGTFAGVALCIGLFFGYYFLINVGLWAGKKLLIPPLIAGWTPNLIFLSLGCYLIWRMR